MPNLPQLLETAIRHHETGQLDQAAALYDQILASNPADPQALQLRGLIEHQRGNHSSAIAMISRALVLLPREAAFWCNLAEAQRAARHIPAAEKSLRRAIELQPNLAVAHNNLALVLDEQNRSAEAQKSYETAIRLQPRYVDAYVNLATHYARREELDRSNEVAHLALKLEPNNVQALTLAGHALATGGEPSAAIEMLGRALALAPTSFTAWHLAGALRERGDHQLSIETQRRAVELDPHNPEPHGNILFNMHYAASIAPEAIAAEHFAWAKKHADHVPHLPPAPTWNHARLRVGYVSGDFRRHAVSQFFRPLLANHHRDAVEMFCYCNNAHDAITEELRSLAEHWRDIHALSDDAAAQVIRDDEIDVLIDLAGHTKGNRLLVFARKPAPIQATYLGYPDTTGMSAIDYRITDAMCDPPGETESLHSEQLERPFTPFVAWSPPADAPEPASPPVEANGYITFGSFNRPSKISSATIELWSKVLAAVPRSRLVIKGFGLAEEATRNVWRARFQQAGVDPQRLDLLGLVQQPADHLRQVSSIDVALDTFPYNGTATTCEAMWMGVPVVTLAGTTHVSRVGVSLLSSAGLRDLIATTRAQYVAIAATLAADVERLRMLRRSLREMIRESSLSNGAAHAAALESRYRNWMRAR